LSQVENEMKVTLAALLQEHLHELEIIEKDGNLDVPSYIGWINRCPAQLVVLATQVLHRPSSVLVYAAI
jgi:hypothetical protein